MKNNNGFTLIEILIAMLVMAVGLLGLAALQAKSLSNNQSAYYRSQATQLAYDIADRMRTNIAGKTTYTTLPLTATASVPNCLSTTGCTPADMAKNDLYEWNMAIKNLPSGVGEITVSPIASGGETYTVTINWDDNRDNDVDFNPHAIDEDTDNDGDTDNDPHFQMSFRL